MIKGTWFVYQKDETTIHIQLKNNGMQYVYVNGELVNEILSLKLRTEQKFEHKGKKYTVRTTPANRAMTSFVTELVENEVLLKIFTFTYRTEIKRFIPFILGIIGCTVLMALLTLPTWSFYVMVAILVLLKILVFNKDLFEITEKDNTFSAEI